MDDYNLEPGEFVVMQEASVTLLQGRNDEPLDELVLTNRHLILVNTASQGLFKRTRYLKRCPLSSIVGTRDGDPQVLVSKYRNDYRLQVVFNDEAISLRFPSNPKRTAERWTESVRSAALGDLSNIKTEDYLPPEVANLVDTAKGAFGAIFADSGRHTEQAAESKRGSSVTTRCVGCHAPLFGRAGSTVTCPYCDTQQTL